MTDHYQQMSSYASSGPPYTCSCGETFKVREELIEHMFDLQGTAFTITQLCGDTSADSGYTWGIKVKDRHTEWQVKDCQYCNRKLSQSAPDKRCRLNHWQAHHMRYVPVFNNSPDLSTTFVPNGVMMCDDCGLAMHEIKPSGCKNDMHASMSITALQGRPMVDRYFVNANPPLDPQDKAVELLSKVDDMLEEGEFYHGPNCVSLYKDDQVAYIECKCGLKPLMDLQLTDIEPFLARNKS